MKLLEPGAKSQIMARSSGAVDDWTLSPRMPHVDWTGYFLFAAPDEGSPVQALNLGVFLGLINGRELGVPQWDGDPFRICTLMASVIDGVSYRSTDDTSYTRMDTTYSKVGLDVQVADVCRVKGSWPYFQLYYRDPAFDITYQLNGRVTCTHWYPDHIQNENMYTYCCFPDFRFEGVVTHAGKAHPVSGAGGFDHVVAKHVRSSSSPSVGFWHYEPVNWGNGMTSSALNYFDASGRPYIRDGSTTLPDGAYRPAKSVRIEYLEFDTGTANAGSEGERQVVPRRWRATIEYEHGVLSYETFPIDVRAPDGSALVEPNAVFEARGTFRSINGDTIEVRGRGHNEYMGVALDPTKINVGS